MAFNGHITPQKTLTQISELPAALLSTPSKMLGTSRPSGEGCDSTLVEAATALINMIARTNTILAC
jgi:hypothetical protein